MYASATGPVKEKTGNEHTNEKIDKRSKRSIQINKSKIRDANWEELEQLDPGRAGKGKMCNSVLVNRIDPL